MENIHFFHGKLSRAFERMVWTNTLILRARPIRVSALAHMCKTATKKIVLLLSALAHSQILRRHSHFFARLKTSCPEQVSSRTLSSCDEPQGHPAPMAQAENLLIQQLPIAARKRLLDQCEPFDLELSTELSVRGQPLSHAYFPQSGFILLVVDVDDYPALEVGMAGRESMLGAELVLGLAKTPWRALVQGAGKSWRIEPKALRQECKASPELRRVMKTSLMVRLHQQTLASACERFHQLGPRLARWLLMSQDRAQADSFHVTQEFMALMLGVRRVGVTVAAGDFQQSGLIRYHRGELTVLNREALKAQACSCYAADKLLHKELTDGQP
jgi:CRP-like cAMP-binding protein